MSDRERLPGDGEDFDEWADGGADDVDDSEDDGDDGMDQTDEDTDDTSEGESTSREAPPPHSIP